MCMVRDVKGVGNTPDIPTLKNTDYLMKETHNERATALNIVDRIMLSFQLCWNGISTELKTRLADGWNSPGDRLDLRFLVGDEN
jgi:hypothetical protein